jgi:hypothetical protein
MSNLDLCCCGRWGCALSLVRFEPRSFCAVIWKHHVTYSKKVKREILCWIFIIISEYSKQQTSGVACITGVKETIVVVNGRLKPVSVPPPPHPAGCSNIVARIFLFAFNFSLCVCVNVKHNKFFLFIFGEIVLSAKCN